MNQHQTSLIVGAVAILMGFVVGAGTVSMTALSAHNPNFITPGYARVGNFFIPDGPTMIQQRKPSQWAEVEERLHGGAPEVDPNHCDGLTRARLFACLRELQRGIEYQRGQMQWYR